MSSQSLDKGLTKYWPENSLVSPQAAHIISFHLLVIGETVTMKIV